MSLPERTGRHPRTYDPEIVEKVLDGLAAGLSINRAAKAGGMSPATFAGWVFKDTPPGIKQLYYDAKMMGIEILVGECFDIADDDSRDQIEITGDDGKKTWVNTQEVQRARVKIDTRKWYVAKVAPRIYGDRLNVEHSGDGQGLTINVVSQIPGPPGELIGQDIPDADYQEVKPVEAIDDLL